MPDMEQLIDGLAFDYGLRDGRRGEHENTFASDSARRAYEIGYRRGSGKPAGTPRVLLDQAS